MIFLLRLFLWNRLPDLLQGHLKASPGKWCAPSDLAADDLGHSCASNITLPHAMSRLCRCPVERGFRILKICRSVWQLITTPSGRNKVIIKDRDL